MINCEKKSFLQWKRPASVEFPKIWHTFKARDIQSDNLVEYRVQGLPLNRADDYIEHLLTNFYGEEPAGKALGIHDDPYGADDYKRFWMPIIAQRTTLVCFKDGSDEIVGANVVYIKTKGDTFRYEVRQSVSHPPMNNMRCS